MHLLAETEINKYAAAVLSATKERSS
jgi:hypothetical protein